MLLPYLKSVLSKSLNFCEVPDCNIIRTYASVQSALDKFIHSISESSKLQHSAFAVWKKIILNKVNHIVVKSPKYPANPILSDAQNIQDLTAIQGRFVIVPVDKASNIVSFVCKRFYKHVLKEEIMKSGNFIPSNYSENTIISNY